MTIPAIKFPPNIDFATAVSLSAVAGWESVPKYGHNVAVGTTSEDVWNVGGIRIDPTVAAPIVFASASANDTALGTGAQAVFFDGVDNDYNRITEVVATGGTSNVQTLQSFRRINTAIVVACGSLGGNADDITGTIGGNTQFLIDGPPSGVTHGEGLAHDGHFTVPMGYTAYVMQVESWAGRDASTEIEMFIRSGPDSPWYSPGQINFYRSPVTVEVCGAVKLTERSDFKFIARADSGTVEVSMFTRLVMGLNA